MHMEMHKIGKSGLRFREKKKQVEIDGLEVLHVYTEVTTVGRGCTCLLKDPKIHVHVYMPFKSLRCMYVAFFCYGNMYIANKRH